MTSQYQLELLFLSRSYLTEASPHHHLTTSNFSAQQEESGIQASRKIPKHLMSISHKICGSGKGRLLVSKEQREVP
jgi:hypothetical protein